MSKIIKGNQRNLTLSDGIYIEQELLQKSIFRSIALVLNNDPTPMSKEVLCYSDIVNDSRVLLLTNVENVFYIRIVVSKLFVAIKIPIENTNYIHLHFRIHHIENN